MTIEEIKKRKKEIAQELRSKTLSVEEIRSLNEEVEKLNLQLQLADEEQEERMQSQEQRNTPSGQLNVLGTYSMGQSGQGNQESNQRSANIIKDLEQRSQQFESGGTIQFNMDESELRSLSTANIPLQGHSSNKLNPNFNEVSSVVDLVKPIPLPGGESYKSGFVVSIGSANYTAESADYHDNADVKTDFVKIEKTKITTYFELPEEMLKLGGNYYMNFALDAAQKAIKKKLSQQIMIGTGNDNDQLTGIFNAPVNVIPSESDMEFTEGELPDNILDKIVFNHGGDESVEGGAYLILNKKTLAEFAEKTTANGDPLYKIKLDIDGNVGTISSRDSFQVPFVINSAVKSWDDAAVGDYFLAYGKPFAYELSQFSGLEVQQSNEFKFKSGQICVRASIHAGGNTASYKGFTRVKKVAAV